MRLPLPLIALVLLSMLLLPRLDGPPRPAPVPRPDCALRTDFAAALAAGRARIASGDLLTPDGASAADAFVAILACRPQHPEARIGLDLVLELAGARLAVLTLGDGGALAAEWYDRARAAAAASTIPAYPAWAKFEAVAVDAVRRRLAQDESARATLAPLLARLSPNHPELAVAPPR